ncbi:MAG TPA: antitoxin family protein [Gemmataceae bacterium]|nr:antitoxin family protein [Gemmataceae bacterium]
MTQVEAIFQSGVFRPLSEVGLAENQRVRLSIQPLDRVDVPAWLDEVREFQQRIVRERGYFPDSTPDIAQDRQRDE